MNSNGNELESPKDALVREAMEYILLYYHERGNDMKAVGAKDGSTFLTKVDRMEEVRKSIDTTGTYEHTFDELQHGAQVAWRNAPKCANRKYWGHLKLLDCRKVESNKGMFDSCIQHLTKAMACGSSEAYVSVFKPAPPALPGKAITGPRIWNNQLLSYAAYNEGGKVIGDPSNLRFTEMLKERFGWDGPPDGKKGPYDYLPLVVQADPKGPPELFEVPSCAPPVHIHHPRYPELSSLDMQWYPIPAVTALDLTLGGIVYTAVPFNGWYANTEVLRDLTDESRYNMLAPVAKALGMDADTKPGEAPLWKDEVMCILSMAVYHSFKTAKVAMIDHHTLIDMFWVWYHNELKQRKYCPVNWKWVIPPMSSSTNRAYLGLNKAQEYTLKPAYIAGASPFQLETAHFGPRDTTKAGKDFVRAVYVALFCSRCIARIRARKTPLLIVYASITGNAAKHASDLGAILRPCAQVSFFDACGINPPKEVIPLIQSATLTIFISSTQGNGELPSTSHKFFSFLFDKNRSLLNGKQCAVLGFGSSAYPIFCGAATHLSKKLSENGAKEVVPRGECDSVKGERKEFNDWTAKLVTKMALMPSASPLVLKLLANMKENTASSLIRTRNMLNSITVELFTTEEVQNAAAQLYMTTRRGSVAGRRRSTLDSASNGGVDEEDGQSQNKRLLQIVGNSDLRDSHNELLEGVVKSRDDIISNAIDGGGNETTASRKTSLVKIDMQSCGNPPYEPGDHIRVIPRNVISLEELQSFVSHLSSSRDTGNLTLDDHIYVSFDEDIPRSELAVSLPLLHGSLGQLFPLDYFFENQVALEAPISMQACLDLSGLASGAKDKAILKGIGYSKKEYENMSSLYGMKWIDVFKTFPSLSKRINLDFLLCNMKMNHPRSYSIASCKDIVGSELHMVVGRFIYSRGGSKIEVGVCSNFLTSVEPGDGICFKLDRVVSFHHPLDPSCPIIFICTGTGFAPIRGLLQKRMYLQSRGEKLGPAYLIFGSRSSSEGLFHDEIMDLQNQSIITKVYFCYSREKGMKREYTMDKLKSKSVGQILSPILEDPNTHIFICGSANMAEGCKDALLELSTQDCFDAITKDGRLHCDVFGALCSKKSNIKRHQSYRLTDLVDDELDDLADLPDLDFPELGKFRSAKFRSAKFRSASISKLG